MRQPEFPGPSASVSPSCQGEGPPCVRSDGPAGRLGNGVAGGRRRGQGQLTEARLDPPGCPVPPAPPARGPSRTIRLIASWPPHPQEGGRRRPQARGPGCGGEAGGKGWATSHFFTSGQGRLPDGAEEGQGGLTRARTQPPGCAPAAPQPASRPPALGCRTLTPSAPPRTLIPPVTSAC